MVDGAVASSAPVVAEMDFQGFLTISKRTHYENMPMQYTEILMYVLKQK